MQNLLILCAIILAIYFYRKNKKGKKMSDSEREKPKSQSNPKRIESIIYQQSDSMIGEYLVIDTETDGLRTENGDPNILRVAWMLFDKDLKIVSKQLFVHRCDGVSDDALKFISMSRAELDSGVGMVEILDRLSIDLANTQLTIAHNVDFHLELLRAHYKNNGQKVPEKLWARNSFCTSKNNFNTFQRYPSLQEICSHYLGFSYAERFNTEKEALVTAECFFRMKGLK